MTEQVDQARAVGVTELVAGVGSRICSLRGMRVMLSPDLAQLYDVETRVLMQAVRRNIDRFPADFMFELTHDEAEVLGSPSVTLNGITTESSRSQAVTLKRAPAKVGRGSNIKYLPFAFTEQGVAMLSSVLRSARAIAVNIEIMRTFVKQRSMLESNKELAKRLAALEAKYDDQFVIVFEAIRELMVPVRPAKKKPIGFIHH